MFTAADLELMNRRDLQKVCKQRGIPANLKTVNLRRSLMSNGATDVKADVKTLTVVGNAGQLKRNASDSDESPPRKKRRTINGSSVPAPNGTGSVSSSLALEAPNGTGSVSSSLALEFVATNDPGQLVFLERAIRSLPLHMQVQVLRPQFRKELLCKDLIGSFSAEISLYILSFLNAEDLCVASMVCWKWFRLCNDAVLWTDALRKRWEDVIIPQATYLPGNSAPIPPVGVVMTRWMNRFYLFSCPEDYPNLVAWYRVPVYRRVGKRKFRDAPGVDAFTAKLPEEEPGTAEKFGSIHVYLTSGTGSTSMVSLAGSGRAVAALYLGGDSVTAIYEEGNSAVYSLSANMWHPDGSFTTPVEATETIQMVRLEDGVTEFSEKTSDCLALLALHEKNRRGEDYMEEQTEITIRMRTILIDWIIEVHSKLSQAVRASTRTLPSAISLIDRYLSVVDVGRNNLQLVGVAALLLASRYFEGAFELSTCVHVCDGAYTESEVQQMEFSILKVLDYVVVTPSPLGTFRRLLLASPEDSFVYALVVTTEYFIDVGALIYEVGFFPPSIIAYSAVLAAQIMLGFDRWPHEMVNATGVEEEELYDCCKMLSLFVPQLRQPRALKGKHHSQHKFHMEKNTRYSNALKVYFTLTDDEVLGLRNLQF